MKTYKVWIAVDVWVDFSDTDLDKNCSTCGELIDDDDRLKTGRCEKCRSEPPSPESESEQSNG